MVETTAEEQNKWKIMKRIEDSLRDFWDNIKCINIWVIGIAEEEEKKKKKEKKKEGVEDRIKRKKEKNKDK